MKPFDLSLYLVTDRALCLGRDLIDVVASAVQGGVTMVQLREKHTATRNFIELAKAVHAILKPLGVPLLINDRLDVALAVGCEGLHAGQDDMHPSDARRLLGPKAILGLSAQTLAHVQEANGLPVDYLGIGPVFATSTKKDAAAPQGVESLGQLTRSTTLPVVAIGGITTANATDVIAAGAAGVAVVSAICSAGSPRQAAVELACAVTIGKRRRPT